MSPSSRLIMKTPLLDCFFGTSPTCSWVPTIDSQHAISPAAFGEGGCVFLLPTAQRLLILSRVSPSLLPSRKDPVVLPSVAVVGATGAVGEIMRQVLVEHQFPLRSIKFVASERSAGKSIEFAG